MNFWALMLAPVAFLLACVGLAWLIGRLAPRMAYLAPTEADVEAERARAFADAQERRRKVIEESKRCAGMTE